MQETTHGFFHLDNPAAGTVTNHGPVVLQGWAVGNHGRLLADLRLRSGGTIHPLTYGFPRADLAAFFGLSAPFLPGGFEITLCLPAGEHEIVFEALTIAGSWHQLHTIRLFCSEQAVVPERRAAQVVFPHEFARALQCSLRAARSLSVKAAVTKLVSELPLPQVIRYPNLPFHGHLHQPTLLERVLFGRLRIEGWLFHETMIIRRVVASVDLQTWQDLAYGGEKPYVEAMFPQFSPAKNCRIDGLIDVPAQLPNPVCVRILSELEDGTWHLCHVQRVYTWNQEQEKVPHATFSRNTFIQACFALDRSCRARGLTVPRNRMLWRSIRGAYAEYRVRAQPSRISSARRLTGPKPVPGALPRQITLLTHNLALEGAPLFLLEFAGHLAAAGVRLKVTSAADGPLAGHYRQLGASVQIADTAPLQGSSSIRELNDALGRLARELDLEGSDLVVANTLSAWWGVHLAARAHRPSLFYIHESTTPATFYLGQMAPATLPLIEASFGLATHVSFLTETTRRYYRPWLGAANHSLNPGWINVAAIDRTLGKHSREETRRDLGIADLTRLIVNVGSVCDRKGQHIFARGVDLLWRQAPDLAASCHFMMVGGRDTLFDHDMRQLLGQLGRTNLEIIPATSTPLPYYRAADLFACSSYEESLPRVIMEAMACHVPILSTAVHGINDLLPDKDHGWLITPGDSQAVSEGLQHMLSHPEQAAAMADHARARVVANYDASLLLPRHAALAAAVASLSL